MIEQLLIEARAYCDARGIKLATLGTYAVQDKTLFARLENGGDCNSRTIMRVRDYIAANPVSVPGRIDATVPSDFPPPEEDAA